MGAVIQREVSSYCGAAQARNVLLFHRENADIVETTACPIAFTSNAAIRCIAISAVLVTILATAAEPASASRTAMPQLPRVGSISGHVFSADTRAALPTVRVDLVSSHTERSRSTVSGMRGDFAFNELEQGRYWLRAERNGWITAFAGQVSRGDAAQSILLQGGQKVSNVEVFLHRLAVITGRVLDRFGEPIESATVTAQGADWHIARTNDIGEFRIPRVPAGKYVVWAFAPISQFHGNMDLRGYGASVVQSLDINRAGEFAVGDLSMLLTHGYEVSGRVVGPDGSGVAMAEVTLYHDQSGHRARLSAPRASALTSLTGECRLRDVVDGIYKLRARKDHLLAAVDVSVTGGVAGIHIALQSPKSFFGMLVINGPKTCGPFSIRALPLDASGADVLQLVVNRFMVQLLTRARLQTDRP